MDDDMVLRTDNSPEIGWTECIAGHASWKQMTPDGLRCQLEKNKALCQIDSRTAGSREQAGLVLQWNPIKAEAATAW